MSSALDAARVQINGGDGDGQIWLEEGIQPSVQQELARMGHKNPIILSGWRRIDFGMGQIIRRDPVSVVLCAGSDPRCDGHSVPLI